MVATMCALQLNIAACTHESITNDDIVSERLEQQEGVTKIIYTLYTLKASKLFVKLFFRSTVETHMNVMCGIWLDAAELHHEQKKNKIV